MALRALSIHAHFYQPPREDPLTGIIPSEAGATPFKNWNERIHAECYRPNAELHNFEQISFNIGPTLSAWMDLHDPGTSRKIIEQDQVNVQRHGVGNAIAQAYNHTILPLGSYRDKVTQVYWGVADFEHRFGRKPQGMWLPETAVDVETLEVLARHNIQFTILAPWQADCEDLDPTEPYIVTLPNQRQMTIFFYHRELSARVSFDPTSTINADLFAQNILQSCFSSHKSNQGDAQLILVASDGELYGHHQHLRDLFLARLVDGASSQLGIRPTYPALWLKSFLPRRRVGIREDTSWSCHHGISRWMGQCSCTPGDANWKAQMRYAFERLASELDHIYQDATRMLIQDPWLLRNRYIHVLLGQISLEAMLGEMAHRALTSQEIHRLHLMLEAQRERQRMFTSCGWFFDDFDRIEPRNNVAYAAQAVRLMRLATGINLEAEVASDLERVTSTRTQLNANQVFSAHLRRAEGIEELRVGFAD
ncbi:MAG: DUF3536 domain-containing protein [Anaerolineales bacterium]|nr:DUF3536 domain-containing protein [Anaerolineales bacterium]